MAERIKLSDIKADWLDIMPLDLQDIHSQECYATWLKMVPSDRYPGLLWSGWLRAWRKPWDKRA